MAALRLPFTLALGFVLVLILDALMLLLVSEIAPNAITVDSFGDALLASLIMAAASVVLEVIFGADDDDTYTLRVIRRIARTAGQANVNGCTWDRVPRDRRTGAAGAAACDARRARAQSRSLA